MQTSTTCERCPFAILKIVILKWLAGLSSSAAEPGGCESGWEERVAHVIGLITGVSADFSPVLRGRWAGPASYLRRILHNHVPSHCFDCDVLLPSGECHSQTRDTPAESQVTMRSRRRCVWTWRMRPAPPREERVIIVQNVMLHIECGSFCVNVEYDKNPSKQTLKHTQHLVKGWTFNWK